MPAISIITPVYNAIKYLPAAINSVLSQDFTDYEWLICDDGSTDGSDRLLSEEASKHPQIQVFREDNSGVSAGRNTCLRHACGRYLMFLDADDTLEDGCLGILYGQMETSYADICFYGWYIHKDRELYSYFFENREIFSSSEDRYRMILTDPYLCGGGYPWNKIWRASSLRKSDGCIPLFHEDLRHYEDKLWTLECLDRITDPEVFFYNKPLYHYFIRNESLSHSLTPEGFMILAEDTMDSLEKITDYVRQHHASASEAAGNLTQSRLQEIISVLREYNAT